MTNDKKTVKHKESTNVCMRSPRFGDSGRKNVSIASMSTRRQIVEA
jgi:hypothetical protein